MAPLRLSDVIAQFPHVDDADVLDKVERMPALRVALDMTRPRNWWGSGVDPSTLVAIAESIPLAWVPARTDNVWPPIPIKIGHRSGKV